MSFGQGPWGSTPWGGGVLMPTISNWSPAPGEHLARLGLISFDVTPMTWPIVHVTVLIHASEIEIAYEKDGFSERYRHSSVRLKIADNGHRYMVRRAGGWPGANVQAIVSVTDLTGATTIASR